MRRRGRGGDRARSTTAPRYAGAGPPVHAPAVEADGAGRSRVRMETDSLDWPAFALGSLGAEFAVLSPPDFADLLRDWADRFTRAGTVVPPA